MGRLDDKVAVITGAGGGMGREAAILFTGEGARVCVADVNAQAAQETVSLCPGEAFSVEVDVADEEGVVAVYAEASQRFGGVDVLYNNAGISPGDDASRHGNGCRTSTRRVSSSAASTASRTC